MHVTTIYRYYGRMLRSKPSALDTLFYFDGIIIDPDFDEMTEVDAILLREPVLLLDAGGRRFHSEDFPKRG